MHSEPADGVHRYVIADTHHTYSLYEKPYESYETRKNHLRISYLEITGIQRSICGVKVHKPCHKEAEVRTGMECSFSVVIPFHQTNCHVQDLIDR